jgi:hypothetical protein
MRLHEISKGTFQRKLQSEWFSELVERINKFNAEYEKTGWKATLRDNQNPMEVELKRLVSNTVNTITLHTASIYFTREVIQPLPFDKSYEHYVHLLDRQPVSQTEYPSATWAIHQPDIKEAKLSKDEFVQRLQDPRKAALEEKLKEWDDILRNRLGWRLDWSTWDIDPNVVTVTAYKPRTLPYPTTTVEDVRSNLWSFLLQGRWDEKNDIQITFEEEDETSVTWEFELTE